MVTIFLFHINHSGEIVMLFEMGAIIVGTALIVLAMVGSIKPKESDAAFIAARVRVPLGLLGVLFIIYGGYSYGSTNTMARIEQASTGNIKQVVYPVEKVQITSPVEGDSVKCRVLTMGVYPEAHKKDIWVLLKPSDGFYYPQSDHTNTSYKKDGEWQVITRFGGDQGEDYDVIVYEADSTATSFFSSTIEKWKEALTYPGLEDSELPAGAIEVDRITVSLEMNCRGVF